MRTRDRARLQKVIDECEWGVISHEIGYPVEQKSFNLAEFARSTIAIQERVSVNGLPAEQKAFDTLTRAIATRLLGECK